MYLPVFAFSLSPSFFPPSLLNTVWSAAAATATAQTKPQPVATHTLIIHIAPRIHLQLSPGCLHFSHVMNPTATALGEGPLALELRGVAEQGATRNYFSCSGFSKYPEAFGVRSTHKLHKTRG